MNLITLRNVGVLKLSQAAPRWIYSKGKYQQARLVRKAYGDIRNTLARTTPLGVLRD